MTLQELRALLASPHLGPENQPVVLKVDGKEVPLGFVGSVADVHATEPRLDMSSVRIRLADAPEPGWALIGRDAND